MSVYTEVGMKALCVLQIHAWETLGNDGVCRYQACRYCLATRTVR